MADRSGSLQDFIDSTNLADYFYNDAVPAHASKDRAFKGKPPVPAAFTNWRDEQMAAVQTAALLHQSHHMPELFIKGPDAITLFKRIAVNTFENYGLDRGKQFIACTPSGHLIGDCILYRHGEESFELVSGAPVLNWVEYQAKTGGYDVEIERDNAHNLNPTGRRTRYRFELCGPNAREIFDRLVGSRDIDIPFFRMRMVQMGGHQVLALRHGMIGSFAVELSGPFDEEEDVRALILEAGKDLGIMPMGMDAYYSGLQAGWLPYPIPGIYTDPALTDYRKYLAATTFEGNAEIGGSFYSRNIEDYYATPYDYGYGNVIKFDHDFYGREALQDIRDEEKRQKVTLVWNREDVLRVMGSQFGSGPRFKSIDLPNVSYAWAPYDEVRSAKGDLVGQSRHAAYQNPLGDILSLALLQRDQAVIGSEVELVWGEPNGGSRKPQVERHEQTIIRARVAAAPYTADMQMAKKV
ncbi:MAG TPA: aminomethyl transferase family protein [Sphingobium sp.]|nr:aminomethyl transferase family protein [Sphingobium sp.]